MAEHSSALEYWKNQPKLEPSTVAAWSYDIEQNLLVGFDKMFTIYVLQLHGHCV